MKYKTWLNEFNGKYKKIRNSGSVKKINDANEVLLKAIEQLDIIIKSNERI
jgi:hypothetical protein